MIRKRGPCRKFPIRDKSNCHPPTIKDQSLNPQKRTQRMCTVGDLRQPRDTTTVAVGTPEPLEQILINLTQ